MIGGLKPWYKINNLVIKEENIVAYERMFRTDVNEVTYLHEIVILFTNGKDISFRGEHAEQLDTWLEILEKSGSILDLEDVHNRKENIIEQLEIAINTIKERNRLISEQINVEAIKEKNKVVSIEDKFKEIREKKEKLEKEKK